MSFQITKGRKKMPFNVILFGVPGIGKSSWAAGYEDEDGTWHDGAPNPIFLGSEENDELEVARYPIPESFDDFNKQLTHLISNPGKYQTVVIDTLDAVEKLLHKKILASDPKQTNSMMAAHGGYAKAYEKAESEFMHTRSLLKSLRDNKGMNIILLAHSAKVKATDTVIGLEYDTYEMNLHKKAQSIFVDWVSAVLFANYVATKKDNDNTDKVFAMGHGHRTIYTAKRPGHLAKNRYNLPYEMDMEFMEFQKAYEAFYQGKARDPKELVREIEGLLENIADEKLVKTVKAQVQAAKDDPKKLERFLARVNELSGTPQTEAANA